MPLDLEPIQEGGHNFKGVDMDANTIQFIVSGIVTCTVAYFGYLSVRERMRGAEHERRIKFLEHETEKCLKEKEVDELALLEIWPSDPKDAELIFYELRTVKMVLKKAGIPLVVRDVVDAIRKLRTDKKIKPEGATDGGYY